MAIIAIILIIILALTVVFVMALVCFEIVTSLFIKSKFAEKLIVKKIREHINLAHVSFIDYGAGLIYTKYDLDLGYFHVKWYACSHNLCDSSFFVSYRIIGYVGHEIIISEPNKNKIDKITDETFILQKMAA